MNYSEDELIELLKNKDKAAFIFLYDNYAGALNSIISRIITDEGGAEDLLQETFILIWGNIQKYESSKGRLFTWMAAIARNLSVDMVRSKAFKNLSRNDDLEGAHIPHDRYEYVKKHDTIGIKKKLKSLPQEYIELIEMAYFFGFTHEQIALKSGMPLGTVKTKLRSAILTLRRELQD